MWGIQAKPETWGAVASVFYLCCSPAGLRFLCSPWCELTSHHCIPWTTYILPFQNTMGSWLLFRNTGTWLFCTTLRTWYKQDPFCEAFPNQVSHYFCAPMGVTIHREAVALLTQPGHYLFAHRPRLLEADWIWSPRSLGPGSQSHRLVSDNCWIRE